MACLNVVLTEISRLGPAIEELMIECFRKLANKAIDGYSEWDEEEFSLSRDWEDSWSAHWEKFRANETPEAVIDLVNLLMMRRRALISLDRRGANEEGEEERKGEGRC